ncbi:MAG: spore photoproduct lyase family protein [Planctomycetota bacterium]|jgi:spore photoproduct lyase
MISILGVQVKQQFSGRSYYHKRLAGRPESRYNVSVFRPEKIIVEKTARRLAEHFLEKLPGVPVEYVDSLALRREGSGPTGRVLALAELRGSALKPFRIGDGSTACAEHREYALKHATGCPYDCLYCYLQSYDGCECPTVLVNRRQILREVETFLKECEEPVSLLAGHLSETLPLFSYDSFFQELCALMRQFPAHSLEVRTKSTDVYLYEGIEPSRNVIPGWTLSPELHRKRYEKRSPSIRSRLDAVAGMQKSGWSVGIRFDPVVRDEHWENAYHDLVDEIFDSLDSGKIRDIHIGALRYVPELGDIIRGRDPRSPLTLGEQFLAPDGKMRYARPLRIEMYRKLVSMIAGRAKIVLVMEPEDIVSAVFGQA